MPDKLQLNPNTVVRWSGERLVISCLLNGDVLAVDDPSICEILHAFAVARPRAGLDMEGMSPDEVLEVVDHLYEMQILRSVDATSSPWELHDALFHSTSRNGMRKLNDASATLAIAPPIGGATIVLPQPIDGLSMALGDALASRQCVRDYRGTEIALSQLSALFYYAMRNTREIVDQSGAVSKVQRPYPSGGAAHSLEVYAAVTHAAIETVPTGLYHYCPKRHVLEQTSSPEADVHAVLKRAQGAMGAAAPPPIVLVITSRFARVAEGYRGGAYSLVAKEVGCLMQTVQLTATALGLGSCPLGVGVPLPTADLELEPTVGEIAIGLPK
ncbi:MAG: SagB family peptide dehydrogenase [Myxococcales bacterium]|nr:SagB family peptide dehydrogenase [Myxococcales bacterium]